MSRIISIRHRCKQTRDGEARPTQIAIQSGQELRHYDLPELEDELDFVHGQFPIKFREVGLGDDLAGYSPRHLKSRPIKKGENLAGLPPHLIITDRKGQKRLVTKVPIAYDGLLPGDTVLCVRGGSGLSLIYAISNPCHRVKTMAIIPFLIARCREVTSGYRDDDCRLLDETFRQQPKMFDHITGPTRQAVLLQELYRQREAVLKDRIACEQRLYQQAQRAGYLSDDWEGGYVKDRFDQLKASDVQLQALLKDEQKAVNELTKLLESMPIYREVFAMIEGVGPLIAARLISAIGSFSRFTEDPFVEERQTLHDQKQVVKNQAGFYSAEVNFAGRYPQGVQTVAYQKERIARDWFLEQGMSENAKLMEKAMTLSLQIQRMVRKAEQMSAANLVKYCGVHLLPDGSFPRRRHGQVANWSNECREAHYLIQDQANYRPESELGRRLRQNKTNYAAHHPETTGDNGKKRYSPSHVARTGAWRMSTQLTRWLYRQGVAVEKRLAEESQ